MIFNQTPKSDYLDACIPQKQFAIDSNNQIVKTTGNYSYSSYPATSVGTQAFYQVWSKDDYMDGRLVSANFDSIIRINNGMQAFHKAFYNCHTITSLSFANLEEVSSTGGQEFYEAFSCDDSLLTAYDPISVTSMTFPKLRIISSTHAFWAAFRDNVVTTSISFPALTSTSFGSYTNQFEDMMDDFGITIYMREEEGEESWTPPARTVHFPSNLQSVIGNWADVVSGFGGTNVTVLFDLPATE